MYTTWSVWSTTVSIYNQSNVVHLSVFWKSESAGSIIGYLSTLRSVVHHSVCVQSEPCGPLQRVSTAWALWFTTVSVHSLSPVVHYSECPQPEQCSPLQWVSTARAVWSPTVSIHSLSSVDKVFAFSIDAFQQWYKDCVLYIVFSIYLCANLHWRTFSAINNDEVCQDWWA